MPHRAQLAVSAAVLLLVLVLTIDLRGTIGFSSLAVLVHYAIANASALRLGAGERRFPPVVAVLGLIGCLVLAVTLPTTSVITGVAELGLGAAGWLVLRRR